MMDCREFHDWLIEYVAGDQESRPPRMLRHCLECMQCDLEWREQEWLSQQIEHMQFCARGSDQQERIERILSSWQSDQHSAFRESPLNVPGNKPDSRHGQTGSAPPQRSRRALTAVILAVGVSILLAASTQNRFESDFHTVESSQIERMSSPSSEAELTQLVSATEQACRLLWDDTSTSITIASAYPILGNVSGFSNTPAMKNPGTAVLEAPNGMMDPGTRFRDAVGFLWEMVPEDTKRL